MIFIYTHVCFVSWKFSKFIKTTYHFHIYNEHSSRICIFIVANEVSDPIWNTIFFLKNIPSHPIGPQLQLIYWHYCSVGVGEGPFRVAPLSPPRRMHVSRWFSQDILVIIKSTSWMIFMTIPIIGAVWRPFWFFGKF